MQWTGPIKIWHLLLSEPRFKRCLVLSAYTFSFANVFLWSLFWCEHSRCIVYRPAIKGIQGFQGNGTTQPRARDNNGEKNTHLATANPRDSDLAETIWCATLTIELPQAAPAPLKPSSVPNGFGGCLTLSIVNSENVQTIRIRIYEAIEFHIHFLLRDKQK